MSGIRIEVIVPIVVMAVKKCAGDMSPYVRKTAAHAIPKIYNLDPSQGPALVETIEALLSDRSTMVIVRFPPCSMTCPGEPSRATCPGDLPRRPARPPRTHSRPAPPGVSPAHRGAWSWRSTKCVRTAWT